MIFFKYKNILYIVTTFFFKVISKTKYETLNIRRRLNIPITDFYICDGMNPLQGESLVLAIKIIRSLRDDRDTDDCICG